MIYSSRKNVSNLARQKIITIFPSINLTNCHAFKNTNKVELDLSGIVSSPVDNIFRIARNQKIKEDFCDVYLLVTELLELIYFTVEGGVIRYSEEELEILQEHFNFVGPYQSNLPRDFLEVLKTEEKSRMVGGPTNNSESKQDEMFIAGSCWSRCGN